MKFSINKLAVYLIKDEVSDLLLWMAISLCVFAYANPQHILWATSLGCLLIIPADIIWCSIVFKTNRQLSQKARNRIKDIKHLLMIAVGIAVAYLVFRTVA